MRWSALSSRERRTVIVGGLVAGAGLFFVWGVRPYRAALVDARETLSTETAALARERAAVASARENPRLLQMTDSAMRAARPRLFEGKDDVMASAELASYLGDVARRARVWMQDAATRPAVAGPDGTRALRVEIRAESDLMGTLLFLQSLERGEKLVRVDRLDLVRSQRLGDPDAEAIAITATISGFATGDSTMAVGTTLPSTVAAVPARGSERR
ncbi:MAG TPA: type II secretion system protein GspM [Gemmatimonadaceae bacterium]|nr:type II secretion system protein GspM [Gemmatimonadaceae bacterium]